MAWPSTTVSFTRIEFNSIILIRAVTRGGPDNDKLVAFPKGFRMLAGDPMKRNQTDDFASRAVSYKCVGVSGDDIRHLPTDKCDQIRAQVTVCFPFQ